VENASGGIRKGRFDIFAAQGWASTAGHTEHSAAYQQSYYLNGGFWINPNWELRLLANYVNARSERPRSEDDAPAKVLPSFKTDSFLSTFTANNAFDKAEGYAKLYYSGTYFYWLDEHDNAPSSSPNYSQQALNMTGLRVKETLRPWEGGRVIAGGDFDLTMTSNLDYNDISPILASFPNMFLFSPYLAGSHTFNFGKWGEFYLAPQAGLRGYVHTLWADALAPQVGLLAVRL
jgi:iron complex outermembrane receptor protein